jgi:hypothetical protein
MIISEVKKLPVRERLLYFVRERYQIYLKKKAGISRPWSDDEIFQTCYFTNVHREQDRVTIWCRENIREPLRDDPRVLFATLTFRWFNWPPTGDTLTLRCPWDDSRNLLTNWDTMTAVKRLEFERDNMRRQVFTGAFNISNSGSTKPKINRVCEDYIDPVWKDREQLISFFTDRRNWREDHLTLEEAFGALSRYPGLKGSGFMAAQIIADLKHTKFLENASDRNSWCVLGPGSKRGLNRVMGRSVDAPIPKDWRAEMLEVMEFINDRNKVGPIPFIGAQCAQNVLCELGKYERVLWGQGRSKRTYNGLGD